MTEIDLSVVPVPTLSNMGRIRDMVADSTVPVAEISRVIAHEIADLLTQVEDPDPTKRNHRSPKEVNDQIKGLRELQKTLVDSEVLSKRDVLNFEGPKFQFVLAEIIKLFGKSLETANVDGATARTVMNNFGDFLRTQDERLRREMNKLDGGK